MVWGKRAFSNADFGRYHERLLKLLYANPASYREFMMVSTKTEDPTLRMYYVGVPLEKFTIAFDEFEYVPDEELPRVIDTVIVADVESKEFITRFRHPSQTIVADSVHFIDDDEVYR
jgi:hypothetical protein